MDKGVIKAKAKSGLDSVAGAGKNFANAGWSALPTPVKGVIFVLVGFGIYKLVKGAISKSRLNDDIRDSKQEVDGWYQQSQIDNAQQQATMNQTEMKQLANKIWVTMDGYGTRDYDLKQAFKRIKNNADFSGVAKAYDVKTLQPGYGIGWMVNSFTGSMVQCIQDDASSSTIDAINKDLKARGIKYRV